MANIKEAFEYAGKNPESDFATNLSSLASSGALDLEAKKYGIDLTPFKAEVKNKTVPENTGVIGKAKALAGGVAEGFGADLPLVAIDYLGKKAVENAPTFGSQTLEDLKQKGLSNLSQAQPLTQKFEDVTNQTENPITANVGNVVGTGMGLATGIAELKAIPVVAKTLAKRNVGKVEGLINPTEDVMTSLQKKQAIQEGRQTIKTTKTGGTEVGYTPTAETTRASELLADTVRPGDKPNVVFAKVKSKIATNGAEAEQYLAKNPVKITNKEDANIFANVKAKAEKNLTENELKAYDEQIKLFQKQLLGRKGGYTTENYYKALKDWEENIAEHLPRGKEALFDPTGVASAKIHAASDIRKAVRDLIGSKHPEFKDKMYDIASLYEAKGNALQIAAKQKSKGLTEKFPKASAVVKNAAIYGGGALGINKILGN